MTQIKTVVIVGAGLAGLRAASVLLQRRGIKCIILEGRDRIGGRAYTSRSHSWSTPLDLGCAWIHGTMQNPLTPIAEAVKAEYYELSSSALWDKTWLKSAQAERLFDVVFGLGPRAVEYSKAHQHEIDPARSFYSFCLETIDKDGSLTTEDKVRAKKLAHFYTNITAEEVTKQSLRNYLLEEELPGASPMVASTYEAMMHHIAAPAIRADCIRLQQKVHQIASTDDGIQIYARHTRSNQELQITADAVILTVPLGVLKAQAIHFSPRLPLRISDAVASLGMGTAEKLFIKFSTAFWHAADAERDMYAFLPQQQDEPLIEFISLAKFPVNAQPVLLCFSAADVASHIAHLWRTRGKEGVKAFVMPYIARLPGYREDSPDCQIEDLFSTNWLEDEFSYGSYSFSPVGSMDTAQDCDVLSKGCPEHHLFFAGEHTASEEANFEIGTAHGAYSSGEHTAKLVLKHLEKA